jgi:hypothetical protein
MRRVASLILVVVAIAVVTLGARAQDRNTTFRAFDIVEISIPELQRALESGHLTSRELVLLYMQRIAQYRSDHWRHQRGADSGDERSDPGTQGSGRGYRRSCRHPELSRTHAGKQLRGVADVRGPRQRARGWTTRAPSRSSTA